MSCDLTNIRDEVYLRISLKKALSQFVESNDFVLEQTWKPWECLEDLSNTSKFAFGKVYVLGGRLGDLANRSRSNMAGPREYGVQLGFQIVPTNIQDTTEMDRYISFIMELEKVCQKEVDLPPFSFTRIEYAVTPEGLPLDFIMQRKGLTFEAYFTAYYSKILP